MDKHDQSDNTIKEQLLQVEPKDIPNGHNCILEGQETDKVHLKTMENKGESLLCSSLLENSRMDATIVTAQTKQSFTKTKYRPEQFDSLKEYQFWANGVGHVMNDLIGGVIFQYALYFYVEILHMDNGFAG